MWVLVLIVGLGGIAAALLAWYVGGHKAKRDEHARLWQQHHDWQEQSRNWRDSRS